MHNILNISGKKITIQLILYVIYTVLNTVITTMLI